MNIEKKFHELRKAKEYSKLGWFLWNGLILSTGQEWNIYKKLLNTLTKKELRLCEKV